MDVSTSNPAITAPPVSLQEIAKSAGDLPSIPGPAMEAMQLTQNPDVNVRALQSIIAKDQALTARVLKIVNSAMYNFGREVSTLSHAIAILGLDTVRSIIVAAALQQVFKPGSAAGKDLTSKLFWEHSWGAAVAAKAIAGHIGYPAPEEAFTCGLLHDMGKMVMLQNQSRRYQEILNKVYCGNETFSKAELRVFGFSHAQVGALLALKWRFPPQLVEAILCHHGFTEAPEFRRLAAIASLADSLMIALEIGFQKDKSLNPEEEESAKYLKLSGSVLDKLAAEVRAMVPTLTGRVQV